MLGRRPNDFERWVAEHPWLYVGIVIGVIVASSIVALPRDGLVLAIWAAMLLVFVIPLRAGAAFARLHVRRYDASHAD